MTDCDKKVNNHKKSALVLGGTSNMAFAMGVLLLSLKATNPKFTDDIIIFHDGISSADMAALNSIYKIRFERYTLPFREKLKLDDAIRRVFTDMVFCKYECFRLLDEYSTIIWMDYDMIISGNVSELTEPVAGGARFILARTIGSNLAETCDESLVDMLDCVGVHSSVFALYDSLADYNKIYEWCIEATEKYAESLYLPDQLIFSLLLKRFNLSVYPLPFDLYSPHPTMAGRVWDQYVKIWHTYGNEKFWNGIDHDGWNSYFDEWLRIQPATDITRKER